MLLDTIVNIFIFNDGLKSGRKSSIDKINITYDYIVRIQNKRILEDIKSLWNRKERNFSNHKE